MCRICLMALLMFGGHFVKCQNLLEVFDAHSAHGSYDWHGYQQWEESLSSTFQDYCLQNDQLTQELKTLEFRELVLKDFLEFVDINNDQLPDVIYTGPLISEGEYIRIYIQHNGSFLPVFEGQQGIFKVKWSNDKLDKLYVQDWGCCASPFLFRSVFQVTYDKANIPSFKQIFRTEELLYMLVKPKHYLLAPIQFQVQNQDYNLRTAPQIDNVTKQGYFNTKGNTMLRLPKGAKGTAYGSKMDTTGRVWWYVTIDPGTEFKDAIGMFDTDAHIVGWLSSHYVTVIEDHGN